MHSVGRKHRQSQRSIHSVPGRLPSSGEAEVELKDTDIPSNQRARHGIVVAAHRWPPPASVKCRDRLLADPNGLGAACGHAAVDFLSRRGGPRGLGVC